MKICKGIFLIAYNDLTKSMFVKKLAKNCTKFLHAKNLEFLKKTNEKEATKNDKKL